ncbi:hypothetical protein CASFOL_033579 [Castilleja foliolosa]|uniref:Water stress and hypersensitive response domain-containing protein n=1 Tax=Castilleja foliolosa TaxID=1961234 RepID=A0ABD3BXC5_9LAMI
MELLDKAKNFVTDKVANMKKPEASITDVDFNGVGRDGVDYLTKVSVTNPYGVSIPICDITYTLKSANRVIVSGKIPDPGSLKGNDNTLLEVKFKIPHSVVTSLIKDIGADWDIDYVLEIGLVIDLPIIGNYTIPLSHKGELKLPNFKDLLF